MKRVECSDRIATGPLQLGNDWPGYFIRGDEALGKASTLKQLAAAIERGDDAVVHSAPHYLRQVAAAFETCRGDKCE